MDGDLGEHWNAWLSQIRAAHGVVDSEHVREGTRWAAFRVGPAIAERYLVVISPVRGGGRGELRRLSPLRARRPHTNGAACNDFEQTADGRVITWAFDLDRDGELDAAVREGSGWHLYRVHGGCADDLGTIEGALVRMPDDVVEPDGWIQVQTDGFVGNERRRLNYVHRDGRYMLQPSPATPTAE